MLDPGLLPQNTKSHGAKFAFVNYVNPLIYTKSSPDYLD